MTRAAPSAHFALSHPAHFIALGFGAGLFPRVPGTAGTALAIPLWWVFGGARDPVLLLATLLFLFGLGVWACGVTGRDLGVPDHGAMCWDEIVAFLLVLALAPDDPWWLAAAFCLFRALDILKPPPIRQAERRFRGGFGVMFDDLIAAGYTLLALAIVKRVLP
jgi:phosphatidylglycerophosphatase A